MYMYIARRRERKDSYCLILLLKFASQIDFLNLNNLKGIKKFKKIKKRSFAVDVNPSGGTIIKLNTTFSLHTT